MRQKMSIPRSQSNISDKVVDKKARMYFDKITSSSRIIEIRDK